MYQILSTYVHEFQSCQHRSLCVEVSRRTNATRPTTLSAVIIRNVQEFTREDKVTK